MKVGIIGITGRIGAILTQLIDSASLIGGISESSSDTELRNLAAKCDVFIDFSAPRATIKATQVAADYGVAFISGTTGLSENELQILQNYAQKIPFLRADNFSIGVQLVAKLLRESSEILRGFDFSIIERHHCHKKDSPSGTARFLADQVSQKAQIASLRVGNLCGEHVCAFTNANEEIIIAHHAFNRAIFAQGALQCAHWIVGLAPGFYTMEDFLNSGFKQARNSKRG